MVETKQDSVDSNILSRSREYVEPLIINNNPNSHNPCLAALRELYSELSSLIQSTQSSSVALSSKQQLTQRQSSILHRSKKIKDIAHDILSLIFKGKTPSPSSTYSLDKIESCITYLLHANLDQLKDTIEIVNQCEYSRSRLGETRVNELKEVMGEIFIVNP
ncbi:predicted protein [Naegleria gruberi]|uniref:Predicted protein n=1 Tax=Naegleria gruberi TaxID=5762 RepID=D2W1K5_NAEGR|nr:uncharacterized protein NAEGRDRAFT_75253 [Naegleria gruberi]EFC37106.1 predicted protein [Naegleria gruberi]|eukprot:XP_002669850.1 predicted protein [Naegleria gruberi strain NEG-M]